MGLTPFADESLTSGRMLGDACRLLCLSAYTRLGPSKPLMYNSAARDAPKYNFVKEILYTLNNHL
ncbi:unnamed protein product [Lupinus luteus]|uniref:Uncharacterized protein n=1 Tax=Lupinus luteus TaxID=3873 RepID=A0AAV1XWL3_LUPLU